MKVRFALTALLALSTLAVACDDEDEDPNGPPDTNTFNATLNGAGERPPVTTTTASGSATFTSSTSGSTTTISYTVTVTGNLSGPVTAAHIHAGTANDLSGSSGIIVPLTVSSTATTGTVVQGSFTTTGNATINMAQLLAQMLAGTTYVNLHTAANPNGEIRGQIAD